MANLKLKIFVYQFIYNIEIKMSSLSNQLNSIKLNQNALKIGPHQQQPTILFDKYTARNTSVDTIYSMAILAYDKISSHLSNSLEEVQNREELLGEDLKQINRNTLSKEENNKLSRKLEKFIIQLAPYLLNSECQHIFEYLLRNFKANIFEAQTLTLSLLHYWNYEIFQKIISNINKRQMTGRLTFLNQMVSTQQINFSFIIKTLTFSHAILDKVISIVLEGSLLEIKTSKDEMIKLSHDQRAQQFLRHPLKNFILKVFLHLIKEKRTNHFKYIIDFCSSCLRIRYPVSRVDEKFELMSSVLILLANLVFVNGVSDDYLSRTIKKLLSKFVKIEGNALSEKSLKQIFDFIMIIWQRKTHIIDRDVVQSLSCNDAFLRYFKGFNSSKYMIFHHVWTLTCFQGAKCENLMLHLGLSVKNQEFFRLHETKFMSSIFQTFQRITVQSNIPNERVQYVLTFIKNNLKHEYGRWINQQRKAGRQLTQSLIKSVFGTSEICAKTHSILIQKIHRVMPQKKVQNKINLGVDRSKIQDENYSEQSAQQTQKKPKQTKSNKKLLQFIQAKGIQVQNNEIDFNNQQTKTYLIQLFILSYEKSTQTKDKINFHQKILILQKWGSQIEYTHQMLSTDLTNNEFAIPIKFLTSKQNSGSNQQLNAEQISSQFQFLQQIFSYVLTSKVCLQNILFKQLLRLSLNRLLIVAKLKYKQAVLFLHKYYKKFIMSCSSGAEFVQVNNLIIKVSEKVFECVGNNKGKYQNLIHSHTKLMAILINSIDSHEFDAKNKAPVITHEILQRTYRSIIHIFGDKQLYLINTGIIELITRKQLNYRKLKYFIDDVMVKELNYELQTQKQSDVSMDYYQHAISVGRCLIFSSYMLGSNDTDWINSIESMLTSGIAKNQISIFYGLIKDKLKRNIARKLFLFFKLTFQSTKFVAGFKNYLTTINDQQMRKLLHIFSQLYYILLSINVNDGKIQIVIDRLLDDITNLFSLDLRLTLFRPILPNLKLFGYLTTQLELHSQANFEQLAQLINIIPDELSFQYVNFVKECLKRGHRLSATTIQAIFTNEHFLNSQDNFQIFCQLICHLSEHDKDVLTPYINQSMNMILAVCSSDSNQDYCLSILYRIIMNLKQLVDPFVCDIYKYALENSSTFVQKFIQDTVKYLTVPTLIQTVIRLSKTTEHLYNFGVFFKYVCRNGVGHLLSKTLQYFASKTIHQAVRDQVDLTNLYELQAEIFLQMALKFNENQLRKVLIDFVRWSEIKQNEEIQISFNMRKIVLSTIYSKLSAHLGNLFTPFYGYVFDSYLKDFEIITSAKVQKTKDGKRKRTQSNFSDQVTLTYFQKVLNSLHSLFTYDTEKQFLDSTKFDILSQRLSNLFIIQRFEYSDFIKMTTQLSSCLITLCHYLTDDYQLKSLNLKILLLLRMKQPRTQEAIFQFMDKLIDEIQDRYLLFVNDLVPFLIENVHNRNEKVKVPIKSIINKFQQMSGNKIENYMR